MNNKSGKSEVFKAHLYAIICVLIWGGTVVAGKILTVDFKAIEVATLRLFAAYLALFLLNPRIKRLNSWKDEIICAIGGFFGMCLFYVFDYSAYPYVPASNISIILAMSPITTVILAKIVLKNVDINKYFPLGTLISVIGVTLVVTQGDLSKLGGGMVGNGLLVLAICCWSVYVLIVKRLKDYNAMVITRKMFGYGLITLIPFLPFMHFAPDYSKLVNLKYILLLVYMGCLGSGITSGWWNNSVQVLSAEKVDPYKYTMPVITIVLSAFILKETINAVGIAGVILTLAGLCITNFGKAK